MKVVLVAILTLITNVFVNAQQLSDSASIKLEYSSKYHLVPVQNNGILIFTNKDRDIRSKEKTWTFSLYDQSFNAKWEKEIKVESKFAFQAYHYGQGKLYLIFNRYKKKLLKVVSVDLESGAVVRQDIETFARFEVFAFKAINDNLFIDARLINSPTLIHADLKANKVRALSTSFKGYPKVSKVDVFPELNKVNVVSEIKNREKREIIVKVYSDGGQELESYKTKTEGNKKLINGTISEVDSDKAFLVGTYTEKKESKEIGMFCTQFIKGKQITTNYLPFTEIDGFGQISGHGDSLLKEKQVKRYRINAHKLIKSVDSYYIIGEAYYPLYRREAHTYFDAAGLPVTSYYQVFDGWNYTHGIICSLTIEGKIRWSKTFDFDNVLSMESRNVVSVTEVDGISALVYIKNGKTVIQPILEEKNTFLVDQSDRPVARRQNNIEYWYNDYFISWSIENDKTDSQKKIIHCNKIDFR